MIPTCIVQPFMILWYGYKASFYAWWIPLVASTFFLLFILCLNIPSGCLMECALEMDKAEGDFRFAHAMVKKQAESAVITGGGPVLEMDVVAKFDIVMSIRADLNTIRISIGTLRVFFGYVSKMITYIIIIAYAIQHGLLSITHTGNVPATFSRAKLIIANLWIKLSLLSDLSENTTLLCGHGRRLMELFSRLEVNETESKVMEIPQSNIGCQSGRFSAIQMVHIFKPDSAMIVFDNVELYSPDG